MHEYRNKIEYMISKNPHKIAEMLEMVYKHNPDIIEEMLEYDDMEHITNKRDYDEHVGKLKWANKNGNGERWKMEDLKKYSKIDFSNVEFTEFDFAYLVNVLYSKCCKYITDMGMFIKIAQCLLEDEDEETKVYKGTHSKKQKQNRHNPQAYYNEYRNEYDEESRRGVRRYRNERMDDYENRYDNREYDGDNYNRRYRNEDTRYYKDTNVGF